MYTLEGWLPKGKESFNEPSTEVIMDPFLALLHVLSEQCALFKVQTLNKGEILKCVGDKIGLEVDVLPGEEETRLVYLGMCLFLANV